jgi:hypothetical protein
MRVRIKSLVGGSDILSGAPRGRAFLASLREAIHEPARPEPVFLDFLGIATATASFLREGPLEFRRIVRSRGSNLYPVIANASEPVLDDLRLLLELRNDAMLGCDLSEAGEASDVRLIGQLEPKQLRTFEIMRAQGEVDAVSLARTQGSEEPVGPTAWNNRLAALAAKSLAMQFARGRTKSFRLPIEA